MLIFYWIQKSIHISYYMLYTKFILKFILYNSDILFKPYQKPIFCDSLIPTTCSHSSDVINSESFKCSVFYDRDTSIQLGFS